MIRNLQCLPAQVALIAACVLSVAPLAAPGQSFPSRPVKIVVPVAAAGALDPLARVVASRLSDLWKQPVLVENRPGANGIIGADYVSKSEPDGYVMLMSEASPLVMSPHLYKKIPYDARTGFTPITMVVRLPWVIGVHASVPANTLAELAALAKAKPGLLSYGSIGLGSSAHIKFEQLKSALGIDIIHVPYKGAGPAMTDLLAGQISMIMITPGLVEPHARSGKLRMIATAMAERIPALPNLPTVAESGVPGFEAGTWFGLMGPPAMSREIVAKIYGDATTVLGNPSFREQNMTKQWMVPPASSTPEQFAQFLKLEYERWGQLIKTAGVSVE